MFGPDLCGPGTKKVHVIFEHKGKNHLIKKDIRCKDDVFTHLYTLILNTDGTYEVLIDNESAQKGSLTEDWDFLPPKTIKDPDATKPEDWDDEMDGEWEPPMIDNPDFKGEWKARQIDNPEYNPDDAAGIAKYAENCKIGFDLWQVKSGTIFDNLLITDDPKVAAEQATSLFEVTKEGEKKMKDAQDEVERAKAEAEAGEKDDAEDDDEDLDDIDEDDEKDLDDEESDEVHDEL